MQLTTLQPRRYFREGETWIKLGALLTSTAVIFAPTLEPWLLHVSAMAVLLGFLGFLGFLGI